LSALPLGQHTGDVWGQGTLKTQRILGEFSCQSPADCAEHSVAHSRAESINFLIATDFCKEKPTEETHALAPSGKDTRLPP